jgi:hypothetical protein
VPADLSRLWRVEIGGRLSQPVIAGGRLYVAQIDAHTVHCLDAADGGSLWSYTVGGRVDSPPTLYRGLVLFGSRDGWLYCLRASDGRLVWRFLAAPQVMNAVAHEQLESLWPVHGSVLVKDGSVYVAAGRSSYLDGGIVLYGLDPETGEVRCTTRLRSEHTGALDPPPAEERVKMDAQIAQNNTDYKTFLAPDRSDAFSMRGALTDVLVADEESIFLRHLRFDGQLAGQQEKRSHLFSTSSLLDGAEHHRSYWVLGTGDFSRTPVSYPWIVTKSLAVPYGLMLVFNDTMAWGVHRGGGKRHTQQYTLFAAPRPDPADEENPAGDFQPRSLPKAAASEAWTCGLPFRPRAMTRAGDTLFIGGEADESGAAEEAVHREAAIETEQSGLLRLASTRSGETLRQVHLASVPVWDGMAAASGCLYISLKDGSLVCLGSESHDSSRGRHGAR